MQGKFRVRLTLLFSLVFLISYGQSSENSNASISTKSSYKKSGFLDVFEGEPGRAALYSLILPGAGQAYNRKWWKVPIAVGIEGALIYNIIDKRRKFRALDTKWRLFIAGNDYALGQCYNSTNPNTSPTQSQIQLDRADARQTAEYSWVYWGLGHLFVTLEAFINRHLINFDISDDLSIEYKKEMAPFQEPFSYDAISLKFTF
jgi:hypothetical protein